MMVVCMSAAFNPIAPFLVHHLVQGMWDGRLRERIDEDKDGDDGDGEGECEDEGAGKDVDVGETQQQ